MKKFIVFYFFLVWFFTGCSENTDGTPLFVSVPESSSSLFFQNTITENDSINVIEFQYCYNGGGVGIGDFNSDGLPDIFFTGNQVSSRLYLNQGNLKFEDVTEVSGTGTEAWITGVSIIDINADGLEDIYLSVGGSDCQDGCKNRLLVNAGVTDGIPSFEEQASEYGLDIGGYSQQTLFFDFDTDGDLDAYVLQNGNSPYDKNSPVSKTLLPKELRDRLLRNEWDDEKEHPVYRMVSDSLGIDRAGFGLGVALNDFNDDGLPDVYVSNDFITEDLLYINRGTDRITDRHRGFEEKSQQFFAHETYNAMGVDVVDINNDQHPDVVVLDMLPEDYERQKKMLGYMNYGKYELTQRNGYTSQYMHNTLQLGNGALNGEVLKSSEVGFISGISSTDWSWAPLTADYDNDGDKDLYVTNGYVKDITDLDFINFSSQNNVYGTPESRKKRLKGFVEELPGIHLPNVFFENEGTLEFHDSTAIWSTETASFSNGAAYADLDLDGDLDMVINNINSPAFLLENKSSQRSTGSFLRIKLRGNSKNADAIGAKIILWANGAAQTQYQSRVKGYLSSVEPILHFGINARQADSIQVVWPDGKATKLYDISVDQVVSIDQETANEDSRINIGNGTPVSFQRSKGKIDHVHEENVSNDYAYQQLLMRQYSKMGPSLAIGDIDGRPGDELFIGGSKGTGGQVWFQNTAGIYEPRQTLEAEYEDADAVFADLDGDNDLDLYVASGGNEYEVGSVWYQDRIYLNDGEGNFERDVSRLPEFTGSNGCVSASDYDQDGDIDLFVGSRLVPHNYPEVPKSYLLLNENGQFKIQRDLDLGLVTDAVWEDTDGDGWDDLIVLGEWMPIRVLKNDKGTLEPFQPTWVDATEEEIEVSGWWNCIVAGDFDKDGDTDFLAGNQGLNGFLQPDQDHPIYVYNQDFDGNGVIDPVVGKYYKTSDGLQLLPAQTRDDITLQMPKLKGKYLTYEAFAKVGFQELLQIENLEENTWKAEVFESSHIENLGDGKFKVTPLPMECQIAPINDMVVRDFDGNGYLDALLVGNDFTAESNFGRLDALNGILLKNSEKGFEVLKSDQTGFYVPNQSHHLGHLTDRQGDELIIATQNDSETLLFSVAEEKKSTQ